MSIGRPRLGVVGERERTAEGVRDVGQRVRRCATTRSARVSPLTWTPAAARRAAGRAGAGDRIGERQHVERAAERAAEVGRRRQVGCSRAWADQDEVFAAGRDQPAQRAVGGIAATCS